jgi:serine/threonine protein kinase
MNNIAIKAIVAMSLTGMTVNQGCVLVNEEDANFKPISVAGKSLEHHIGKNVNFEVGPVFDTSSLCRDSSSKSNLPKVNSNFLGEGSFGKVFQVKIGKSWEAVKKISFKKFYEKNSKAHFETAKSLWAKYSDVFSELEKDASAILNVEQAISKGLYEFAFKQEISNSKNFFDKKENIKKSLISEGIIKGDLEVSKILAVRKLNKEAEKVPVNKEKDKDICDLEEKIKIQSEKISKIENTIIGTTIFQQMIDKVLKEFIDQLNREAKLSFDLSQKPLETSSGYKIFPKMKSCYVTKDFDVYLVMEKLSPNLESVSAYCGDRMVGPKDFKEMLLILLQFVVNAAEFSKYGITHCDIKPVNVAFGLDFKLPKPIILDFGMASNKNICVGGTPIYQPPELIFPELESINIQLLFKTWIVHLSDAYSTGFTLLAFMIKHKTFIEIIALKEKLILDLKNFKGNNFREKIVAEHEKFEEKVRQKLIKNSFTHIVKGKNKEIDLGNLLIEVVMNMINGDFACRYSLQVAVYALFKLYECAEGPNFEECENIERLIINNEAIRDKLIGEKDSVKWSEKEGEYIVTWRKAINLFIKNNPVGKEELII